MIGKFHLNEVDLNAHLNAPNRECPNYEVKYNGHQLNSQIQTELSVTEEL